MSAPKKNIPDVVGQRMLQLSLEGYGSRRISRIVASEYGPECKYSHTYIQNFLNDHASVANTFQHDETSTQIVNPEPSVELARVADEQQLPARYVIPPPYAPVSPTIIVSYVPLNSALPGDSMDQVFLDLIRAQGMAAIQHRYQQKQEASVQPTENKDHDNFQSLLKEVRTIGQQQEKERQERARRLEAVQNGINEQRKKMDGEFAAMKADLVVKKNGNLTELPAARTEKEVESESNMKAMAENNQLPCNETASTHQDAQAMSMIDKKVDSMAVTPVKSPELTTITINDSKKLDDRTHEQVKQTVPLTTAGGISAASTPSTLDQSITSTPGVRNNGFSPQPDINRFDIQSRFLEPDQRSVANNIPEHTPPTPTNQKDQLQFKRIQAAQDAGLTRGSHNRDDGSSTNPLLTLVGLGLGVLGLVFGIDYVKARAYSRQSSQMNSNAIQPSTLVEGYLRINNPNGTAVF